MNRFESNIHFGKDEGSDAGDPKLQSSKEARISQLNEEFGLAIQPDQIIDFIGNYPMWSDGKELDFDNFLKTVSRESGIPIESRFLMESFMVKNPQAYIQNMIAESLIGRKFGIVTTGDSSYEWISELRFDSNGELIWPWDATKDENGYDIELSEGMREKWRSGILGQWRKRDERGAISKQRLGRETFTPEELASARENVFNILRPDDVKEFQFRYDLYGLTNAGASRKPESYATPTHDRLDNLKMILAAGSHRPNPINIIRYAYDPELVEKSPEDARKAAKYYWEYIQKGIASGNPYLVKEGEPTEGTKYFIENLENVIGK